MGPSIHPYRKDAIKELEYYYSKGVRIIKWLPNSMFIDPSSPKCDLFYDKMRELNMILLSHTGDEHSLDDADYTYNEFGNPLLLKRALDKGVKVIMAHCASEGHNEDLDETHTSNETALPQLSACDLFIRLMKDKKYENLLFGDISAMISFRRVTNLVKIIKETDIHDRLIYGSDYPVPCLNCVVWFSKLRSNGLINDEHIDLLNEIYQYNPILCDFVIKRIISITQNGKKYKFADIIFQRSDLIEPQNLLIKKNKENMQDYKQQEDNEQEIDLQVTNNVLTSLVESEKTFLDKKIE